jgi:hypothetical protein
VSSLVPALGLGREAERRPGLPPAGLTTHADPGRGARATDDSGRSEWGRPVRILR